MILFKRKEQRDADDEQQIVTFLARHFFMTVYGADIDRGVKLPHLRLHSALARLETSGVVVSDWAPQPVGSDRRWFRLTSNTIQPR